MPSTPELLPISFTTGVEMTPAHLPEVAHFTCALPGKSEERFEQEVSDWLRDSAGGALEAIRLGRSEVRLFFCSESKALIAYGAIGIEDWSLSDGSTLKVWVLQYAGVHSNFRGLPSDNPNYKFGKRLLHGMIQEMESRGGAAFVGLFVDPTNPARTIYHRDFGFQELDTETDGDRTWVRMIRELNSTRSP